MTAILEYWRPVSGYEGIYDVSDQGTVRSLNYGRSGKRRELKSVKNNNGYEIVTLSRDGVVKCFTVHRLVWEAFKGEIHEGKELDHINTIRDDNRLVNLRVVTRKENVRNNPITRTRHLEATREANKRRSEDPKWRDAVRKAKAKPVLQLDKETGALIREWQCASDAARELGIRNSSISLCCSGKCKTAGGFKWQYIDYHYSS